MPPAVALRVTAVLAVTTLVVTLNVVLLAPAATVMLAGTVATVVLLLESVTAVAAVTGAVKLTLPVAFVPPLTVKGLSVTEDSAARLMVSVADLVTPPYTAE